MKKVLSEVCYWILNNHTLYILAPVLSPTACLCFYAEHSHHTYCNIQKLSLGCHFHIFHLLNEASKRKYCFSQKGGKNLHAPKTYLYKRFKYIASMYLNKSHLVYSGTKNSDQTKALKTGTHSKTSNFEGQFSKRIEPVSLQFMKIIVMIPMTMNMPPEKPG